MHASDVYDQLAAGLTSEDDPHILLTRLLEPVMHLTGAGTGSVAAVVPGERGLRQIAAFGPYPTQGGGERAVVVPLTYRGRALGEYRLWIDDKAVLGDDTAAFHRTIGALLGLALHDAGQERESRQAIVADVHDGIAQTLVFAGMRMPLLEQAIAAQDAGKALRCCADLRQAISSAHTTLRAILSQCGTPMDPKGLKHALGSSVRSFHELTQIDLVYEDRAPGLCLSASQESQVYLIVQEALANIAKHAGARHAWLHVEQQGDSVDVLLEDDGMGLPNPAEPPSPSHFGMDIMRQRAARLGGGIEIAAREGGGTRMTLSFPIGAPT